jgi:polyribonucleotide 5'-hydroxyl-kinase
MAIPGLSINLPGLTTTDPSNIESSLPPAQTIRTQTLSSETEYRFESSFTVPISIKLLSGTAELFGTELAPHHVYTFQGAKAAIFTWHGCTLEITGSPEAEYVAEETPMFQTFNLHLALENLRLDAQHAHRVGPRVMVVGPENAGKSSLVKTLAAYALKMERQPVVVNLDPRQGLLSMPGSLSATAIASVMDIEEGWGSSPISGPSVVPVKMPLCYHYGCQDPEENAKLFRPLVSRLGLATTSRLQEDPEVRSSGCLIDTAGALSSGKQGGYELIQHIASEFQGEPRLAISNSIDVADFFWAISRPSPGYRIREVVQRDEETLLIDR